jgi:predicted AAA+ superfamily ATPase
VACAATGSSASALTGSQTVSGYNRKTSKNTEHCGYNLEELLRRGWTVRIGKIKNLEADFIAEKGEDREYFQVTMRLANDEAVERELAPLRAIRDS